jgi:hypothetical protein
MKLLQIVNYTLIYSLVWNVKLVIILTMYLKDVFQFLPLPIVCN